MKSLIFTVIAIIFIGAMLGVSLSNPDTNTHHTNTLNKLNEIKKEYNNTFFYSLYSIKELKSTSLNSIEKLSKYDDNKWISPITAAEMLTAGEKEKLLSSTALYLDNINDEATKFNFIIKIKRWCLAESQIEFICKNFSYRKELVIATMDKLPELEKQIAQLKVNDSNGNKILKVIDYDKAYFMAVNYLSELPINNQMEIYSKLYKELSVFEKN